jgi:thioredoxin:protein disulfide reductase
MELRHRFAAFWICALALAPVSFAQSLLQDSGPRPSSRVDLGIEFDRDIHEIGSEVTGTVIAMIDEGWHINSYTPIDEFSIPTALRIESPALEVTSIDYPPHKEKSFQFADGQLLAVYEGDVEIAFRGVRLRSEDTRVRAVLYYQACDDNVCLPPREAVIETQLGTSLRGSTVDALAAGGRGPAGDFQPLSEAPPGGGSIFRGDLQSTFEAHGLLLTLAVVFVLGLALTLTPCVYPLIPITIGYFSSQQGGRRSRVLLSILYVLGIALTYSALGVTSALSGRLFGAWLQSSFVLIFFAFLMVVLSASMFGLYDIRVPQFITARSGAKAGYAGALTMGLLAGIVAAPCVGPFVISLIALVSQSGSVGIGFILFFVLALGLGVPFLFLGIFSSAANSMPRSGPWLLQIKKAFGFILIAMAFYFLRPIIDEEIYRMGVALSLLLGAGFLLFGRGMTRSGNVIRIVSGVVLLIGGIAFAVPANRGPQVEWEPFSRERLEEAEREGRPVMIDFYADWCLPCKELDARTFTDEGVIDESTRFVRLKADLTRPEADETKRLTEQFEILGVPTIVFLDPSGNEIEEVRLVGFERPAPFLDRMQKVR